MSSDPFATQQIDADAAQSISRALGTIIATVKQQGKQLDQLQAQHTRSQEQTAELKLAQHAATTSKLFEIDNAVETRVEGLETKLSDRVERLTQDVNAMGRTMRERYVDLATRDDLKDAINQAQRDHRDIQGDIEKRASKSDLDEVKDTLKWVWRTIGGAVLVAAVMGGLATQLGA